MYCRRKVVELRQHIGAYGVTLENDQKIAFLRYTWSRSFYRYACSWERKVTDIATYCKWQADDGY